jgi:hypothetical protein
MTECPQCKSDDWRAGETIRQDIAELVTNYKCQSCKHEWSAVRIREELLFAQREWHEFIDEAWKELKVAGEWEYPAQVLREIRYAAEAVGLLREALAYMKKNAPYMEGRTLAHWREHDALSRRIEKALSPIFNIEMNKD